MPELPEVETVVRELGSKLPLPLKLVRVVLHRRDLRNPFNIKNFKSLEGQSLTKITRRSKYLLFWMEREAGFLSHLGMTGHWRIEKTSQKVKTRKLHDHIELDFINGETLIYNDPRRFGFFDVFDSKKPHSLLKNLGPEPLGPEFSASSLYESLQNRSGVIKNLLMDQKLVAGVGNIYASEILFRARVSPKRRGDQILKRECETIVHSVCEVLTEALQAGGSSIDDFRHVSGESGEFQNRFFVYGREGEGCRQCGHIIRKTLHSGRSTYWCAKMPKVSLKKSLARRGNIATLTNV